MSLRRILRICRVVADLRRAETFYREALAFRSVARGPLEEPAVQALGAGPAEQIVMRLGDQEIALVCFAAQGRPPPPESRSDDLWFQHLAIVVADMDLSHRRLCAASGWRPISIGPPATLPPANGSVKAFKFRDPDDHPLELIWFPPGVGRPTWQKRDEDVPFLGIDHSAIAIGAEAPSSAFYRGLGFEVQSRTLNSGPAQDALDGLSEARPTVVGLRPPDPNSLGLELLAYDPPGRPSPFEAANDLVTDWIVLSMDPAPEGPPRAVRDPDGHLLLVGVQGDVSIGAPA